MKHNNVIPNIHFRKKWSERVKTWFNQPGKKVRRRTNRAAKAARIFPRPVAGALRPVVRGMSIRYNTRSRLGRGFSLVELKEAGINKQVAPTIGISVDHRRRNRSEESVQANVQRLKEYHARLVVFPRKAGKPKKGDASAEDLKNASQFTGKLLPLQRPKVEVSYRAITPEERKTRAFRTLVKARHDARIVGIKKKKETERLAAAANAAPSAQ